MSYQEKKTLTGIASGIILMTVYVLNAWSRYKSGSAPMDDGSLWAVLILKYIGIGIAITISLQILFHILVSIGIAVRETMLHESCEGKEIERTIKQEMMEDERDKLIELKSLRAGFILAGIGFFVSLVTTALAYPAAVMLNILFFCFWGGAVLEGLFQLYYYRRGL